MDVKQHIETTLTEALIPNALEVVNESHMHNVPANSETHFKVTVVSEVFSGKRLIQRHRLVNSLLADMLAGPVHALALHTYTEQEWIDKHGVAPNSPNCLGGSKK